MPQARRWRVVRDPLILLVTLSLHAGLSGCHAPSSPHRINHNPVIDSLIAVPDTIGPSDSTVVTCFAHDIDGDSLVYDWETDGRLNIQGTPTWNKFLNQQHVPSHTFYNANITTNSDSAWVFCEARDMLAGGVGQHVFIILRHN
jgi:hypothetical protein